jgi:phospholipid/cholesterol/gamma-HCH transport system substrate-binding protein
MKFRIKYADQVVGAFVLLALLALGLTLILIGMNQRWFAKNYHFRSEFSSASNLDAGMAIRLKGFVIGKISTLKLNESNGIDVDFYIYDTYYEKVKEFSVLELTVSPIGLGASLLFHPGRGTLVLPEGSFVYRADSEIGKTVVAADLVDIPVKDDTISRLFSNLNPLLEKTNKTMDTVDKTISELRMSLRGEGTGALAGTMRGVESSIASLDRTLGSVGEKVPSIMSEVDTTLKSVNAIAAKVDGITDDLKRLTAALSEPGGAVDALLDPKGSIKTLLDDDNALYNRINALLDQVASTMSNVDSISRRVNNEMPGLSVMLSEGKSTLVKAQDVLEGLKNNPLLKGGIPERKSQDTLFRSMRDEEF